MDDETYDYGKDKRDALEAIMDQCSPYDMCEMLAVIANEKADHVRTNWQDEATAKQWERVARKFEIAAQSLVKLNPYA